MAQTDHTNSRYHHQNDATPQRSGSFAIVAGVIATVAAVAVIISFAGSDESALNPTDPAQDLRPVGAGTLPDGTADELREGLTNTISASGFVENLATSDAPGNPMLDADTAEPPQATSIIEELEPGSVVDGRVL